MKIEFFEGRSCLACNAAAVVAWLYESGQPKLAKEFSKKMEGARKGLDRDLQIFQAKYNGSEIQEMLKNRADKLAREHKGEGDLKS